jgi:hypothetical protein
MDIRIMQDGRKILIGKYDPEKKLLRKRVKESKHLFRTLDAWGVDIRLFDDPNIAADASIEVYDDEERVFYLSTVRNFRDKGKIYHFKKMGIDYQTQIFLPRQFWDVRKKAMEMPLAFKPKAPKPKLIQQTLF